jgi:hypothetical protein
MTCHNLASATIASCCFLLACMACADNEVPSAPAAGSNDMTMTKEQEAQQTGVQAVIYGLPLVMMELTMQNFINAPPPKGAPANQFLQVRSFPTASFKQIVRANVDTLYSSAFLDLSKEPLVLSVPDTHGRYFLLPLFDAWTNVFASPGTRTTGDAGSNYVIAGPDWSGTAPPGLKVLKSPTNMAWLLGRTQTNGPADYPAVHAIQDGYKLTPLSRFGTSYTPPTGAPDPAFDAKTPPVEKLKAMSAAQYFGVLARLLRSNPPTPADAPFIAKLAHIGIVPGQPFDPSHMDPAVAKALEGSVSTAIEQLQRAVAQVGTSASANGWRIPPTTIGNFGTGYFTRALITWIAFGANLPADAVYPTSYGDADGNVLNGSNRYTLHFEKGNTPPVNAFWSITMYGPDSFFVDNPMGRYAVSSWMPLRYGSDGSIDLYVQKDSPGKDKEANWLPAPAGDFNVTLRMYWPKGEKPSILDGTWIPPGLTKVWP